MNFKRGKKALIILGMVFCVGWLVTGCATSQQLLEVQDQANLAMQTAEQALKEAQAAKIDSSKQAARAESAAVGATQEANRAGVAADRAERAAAKAEAMAEKTENIFMKKMKK